MIVAPFFYICPMRLLKIGDYYVWHGGFHTKDIPKTAGMRWNPTKKRWETKSVEIALSLKKYATDDALKHLTEAEEIVSERIKYSTAVDANISIPAPGGLKYFGYQKAGIAYAIGNQNVLIGDEMGLGKTIQAIGVMNFIPEIKVALVVCPASLKINWKKEIDRWLLGDRTCAVLSTKDKDKEVQADVLIANYELLGKLEWLRKPYDLIVADEAHYLKNPKAARTKHFTEVRENANRLLLLTGTPILNRPIELWSLLQLLRFDMRFWEFAARYCGASEDNGWDVSGATNMAELQQILRKSVMIRRRKADVLGDLPDKTRQIIYLDPARYKPWLSKETKFMQKAGMLDEGSIAHMHEPTALDIGEMSRLRHETALAKVPEMIDFIGAALDAVDKVVVFANHRDVIEQLYSAYPDIAVKLMGGMTPDEKDDAVVQFQTNPDIRLFVGSIKAAGVGITLTAAQTIVFAELDWVPGNILQAEDRLHRIGQKNNVMVYYVVVDGSMDAMFAKRFTEKQAIIDEATDVDVMLKKMDENEKRLDLLERFIAGMDE